VFFILQFSLTFLILKIKNLEILSKIYFALLAYHAYKLEAKQDIALPSFYATITNSLVGYTFWASFSSTLLFFVQ